jgi:predicted TPR repeat methyltransferase
MRRWFIKDQHSSHMIQIQTEMTRRAIELLNLPKGTSCYLLDLGCGSALSGAALSEEGHYWVGLDIAPAMLRKCSLKVEIFELDCECVFKEWR